ncbi:MAG TPA: T9SS type A sorting domain-containing protein [Bacteroidales bacterium]|nr:T9SS type A sorting domain-containing protein [Bacteroidales bacterium]HPS17067.1 T9SS type A sorting domain-containing protein [Bacteroidales bacterium]
MTTKIKIAFLILMMTTCNIIFAQENNSQSKSYMKIKTMKIINGDTIINEKEYTGDGNMNIEDSLTGEGFGNFNFNFDQGNYNSDMMKKFSDMQNMFKDFSFGADDFFKNDFNIPEFEYNFNIDSIIREFNFPGSNDSLFRDLNDHRMIIKSYKDKQDNESIDKTEKPDMDIQLFGKDDKGRNVVFNKKIIIENDDSKKEIKNCKSSIDIEVFPNPADGYFNISFPLDEKNKTIITVSDVNGKQLLKEILEKADGLYTRQFDMKAYEKGTYMINIKQGKKQATKKIIIS